MIGKTISHYTTIEELGRGGMGEVYLAEDVILKRKVALKFLSSHLTTDTESIQRFKIEAQAAAALNHPAIITIYEINNFGDKTFIAMEYVDGITLRSMIDKGPLPFDACIDIVVQLCQGLDKAHQAGIIHRDIKPENIMVNSDNQVKILDFGLAKLKNVSQLTKDSSTLGTIKYMSPEQIRGDPVDARTDIWSLGVVLYEMFSGQVPFKGDYEQAMLYSIINEHPLSLKELTIDVPDGTDSFLSQCLQKEPADRYQNTGEIINALTQQKTAYALNSPPSTPRSADKPFFKNRAMFTSTVMLITLILVAGYFLYSRFVAGPEAGSYSSPAGEWENSIVVLPFQNISADAEQEYFCDGMTEQIISSLSRIKKLKVISRTSAMKYKASERTIPELAAILDVNYVLEGSVRKSENRLRLTAKLIDAADDLPVWSEDYNKPLGDIFDLQDDLSANIITALLSELSPEDIIKTRSVRSANIEAYEYFLKGKYYHEKQFIMLKSSEESFKLAEMMFKKSINLDSTFALPLTALADLYHSYYLLSAKGARDKQTLYQLMNRYLNKAFSLDSTLAYNFLVKGRLLSLSGHSDQAFIHFRKAVQLNPNNGWINQGLGSYLFNRGLHSIASRYADKSVYLDPLEPNFLVFRGLNHHWCGRFKKAEADYINALQLDPQFVYAIENYLHLLIELKRFSEAETLLQKLDENNPNALFIRAKLAAAKGDKNLALQLVKKNKNLQLIALLNLKEEAAVFYKNALAQDKNSNSAYYWLYKTNPCYDNLRDDPRFKHFLGEQKKIYEQNLIRYGDL